MWIFGDKMGGGIKRKEKGVCDFFGVRMIEKTFKVFIFNYFILLATFKKYVILSRVVDRQQIKSNDLMFQSQRCKTPPTAPQKIEKVISTCQEEIKLAILQGK